MGVSTRCYYGIPIRIYRLSTVYVPCIYRISTVVDSGGIELKKAHCCAFFSYEV